MTSLLGHTIQSVVKHDVSEEVICPGDTTFLQFVADSSDHDVAALDGGGTHRGLGSIVVPGGERIGAACPDRGVPGGGGGNWGGIKSCGGIKIRRLLLLLFNLFKVGQIYNSANIFTIQYIITNQNRLTKIIN